MLPKTIFATQSKLMPTQTQCRQERGLLITTAQGRIIAALAEQRDKPATTLTSVAPVTALGTAIAVVLLALMHVEPAVLALALILLLLGVGELYTIVARLAELMIGVVITDLACNVAPAGEKWLVILVRQVLARQ